MKYILGVFAVVFVLIAIIFWTITTGDNEPDTPVKKQTVLTDYADSSAKVIYELRGELIADEERKAVRITVDRNRRLIEVLDGYQQKVIKKKSFTNNAAAFDEFVHGLSRAGFVTEQKSPYNNEKGVCPNGNVTIYTLAENSEEVSRLWGVSCYGQKGTFDGSRGTVKDLFEDQIPNYRDFMRGIVI